MSANVRIQSFVNRTAMNPTVNIKPQWTNVYSGVAMVIWTNVYSGVAMVISEP